MLLFCLQLKRCISSNFEFFSKKFYTPNLTNRQCPAEMYAQKQDIFYEEIFSDGGVVVKIGLLFYGGGVGSSPGLYTRLYLNVPFLGRVGLGLQGGLPCAIFRHVAITQVHILRKKWPMECRILYIVK